MRSSSTTSTSTDQPSPFSRERAPVTESGVRPVRSANCCMAACTAEPSDLVPFRLAGCPLCGCLCVVDCLLAGEDRWLLAGEDRPEPRPRALAALILPPTLARLHAPVDCSPIGHAYPQRLDVTVVKKHSGE